MKELLRTIAENIVDNPDEVSIKEVKDGDSTTLELTVADDDMGKVIGKGGRVAKAIRTLINAGTTKSKKQVRVEIKD